MKRSELIKQCRYYKGEKDCPYNDKDPRYTAWGIERIWVDTFNREDYTSYCIEDYIRHGMSSYRTADGIPLSLKATLMNRYFYYADREMLDDFKVFYESLY